MSSRAVTVSPAAVLVAAMVSMMTWWLASGRAPPGPGDVAEQPVPDLVPLGGAGREVAHRDLQSRFRGEPGQLRRPCRGPVAVGAAGVGGDQQLPRARVAGLPERVPPAADRFHGERRGVMVGADVHEPGIVPDVVHPVRDRRAAAGVREVMVPDPARVPLRPPLPALAGIQPDQLFLLGVDADHRIPRGRELPRPPGDAPELAVPVRVPPPLHRPGVALRADPPACSSRSTAPLPHGCPRRVSSAAMSRTDSVAHTSSDSGSPRVDASTSSRSAGR